MKQEIEDLRTIRLQVAIATCQSPDGDISAKLSVLKALCEADPVIANVLRFYGVDVGSSAFARHNGTVQTRRISAIKVYRLYKKHVQIPNSKDPKTIFFRVVFQAAWIARRQQK